MLEHSAEPGRTFDQVLSWTGYKSMLQPLFVLLHEGMSRRYVGIKRRQVDKASDDAAREVMDAALAYAFRQSVFAASKTLCSVGTVRSSSTGENGTGTSMAPMRRTGASRW